MESIFTAWQYDALSIMLIVCGSILGGYAFYLSGQVERKYNLYKDLKNTYFVKKVN